MVCVEVSSGECPKPPSSPRSLANSLGCRKEPSSEGVKGWKHVGSCCTLIIRNKPKDRPKLILKPGAI